MQDEQNQQESSYESWQEARRIAGLVANVSALFSTAIRYLKKDAEAGAKTLTPATLYCLQRLLNSDSFKAPVFYTAKTLKTDLIPQGSYLSTRQLASLFTPEELASVVGLLYLYRRIQKGCDETEWGELSKQIHIHGEIGGRVGRAIPKIGLGWGLMLGSIRHLSLGLFLGVNKKEFVQYRRGLKIKKLPFDLEEEKKVWGCNHLQVASILIQAIGLGSVASKSITTGLLVKGLSDKEIDVDAYRARILWAWLQALRETGAPPQITHRGDFYPLKDDLQQVVDAVQRVRKEGGAEFFSKGKQDISKELTPCLFENHKPEADQIVEDVPEELVEEIDEANLEAEEI